MESYKCLAPPLEPLDQVEGIEYGANKKVLSVLFGLPTEFKSIEHKVIFKQKENSYLTLYQVDGHTLSSVSLASVGCPDPALLSNIFQVRFSVVKKKSPNP